MANEIERPRNCGECARMSRGAIELNGERYDGGCPEWCMPVKNEWVCHPNVGRKKGANP